jgi:hypothetical protein
MTIESWHYGRSEIATLEALHRSMSAAFPSVRDCWPFAPYVGERFHHGPRLVFYGKATGGWGKHKPLPAKLTPRLLNDLAGACVADPRPTAFWSFLDEAAKVVFRALGYAEGKDWSERRQYIAWSNYLKVGEDAVAAPGLKVYEAQRQTAEALMSMELHRWRPRVVITVTNHHYGPTTARIFGEDDLWDMLSQDLWVRDAKIRGSQRTARVFWSVHPQGLPHDRRDSILKAIGENLREKPQAN